jgi:phosphatidate cytidylyltransferase
LGAVGGALTCGLVLSWAVPLELLMTILLSLVVGVMGFAGGLTMSAIKRDRGVDDYGTLVTGHGGVLDRIDALCFAAPVYYQICKYYFWFHEPPL